MSSVVLKIIAILCMIIDHTGFVFFGNNIILRMIGRIAFPLFAFTFCEGTIHTHDPIKRDIRILIMAIITEPIFDFALFGSSFYTGSQNVLLLFALASLATIIIEKKSNNMFDTIMIIIVASAIAEILRFDYGAIGMVSIFICSYFVKNKDKLKNYQLLSSVSWLPIIVGYIPSIVGGSLSPLIILGYAVPPLIILMYNGQKGNINKGCTILLQISYPMHLLIIALLRAI